MEMGCNQSNIATCNCPEHRIVTYIYYTTTYNVYDPNPILKMFWVGTSMHNNQSEFWACNACYQYLPENIQSNFQYVQPFQTERLI